MRKIEKVIFIFAPIFFLIAGCSKHEAQTEVNMEAVTRTAEIFLNEEVSDSKYPEAPDFVLADLSGNPVQLSDFKGKMIILNFWATWCGPCREEIPFFVEMYKKHKDDGLMILGISLDQAGVETVKHFADKYNMNYPVLLTDNQVHYVYGGIQAIPTSFIISRNGRVVNRFNGNPGEEAIKHEIEKWLKI